MSTTRRKFLALLGIGGASAITPRLPKVEEPKCECPVEDGYANSDLFGVSGAFVTIHFSHKCPIHAEYATRGCGVYNCTFEGCDNPRTEGLIPQKSYWKESRGEEP